MFFVVLAMFYSYFLGDWVMHRNGNSIHSLDREDKEPKLVMHGI